jgi:tripartite-type tricarboxylate transporter receptor subunit TctC
MRKSIASGLIASVVGVLMVWAPCLGAGYPEKPITLIVPWGAGGNADVQARILVEASKEFLRQPIIVTNKPGGATVPGLVESLQAPADGYTLIWIALPSVATQPYLKKTPFTFAEFTPIANVSENSLIFYVTKDSPWQTLDQFISHAKEKPVNVSCNGIGALPHLAGAELAMKTGAKMKFLPYESSAHAVVALIGKHMDAAIGHELQAFTHGEQVRPLAVFEENRLKSLPAVPTAKEQGYPVVGYVRDSVAINRKAPKEVVEILGAAFKKALESPKLKEDFAKNNIRDRYLDSNDTFKLWQTAAELYGGIIKELKLGEK